MSRYFKYDLKFYKVDYYSEVNFYLKITNLTEFASPLYLFICVIQDWNDFVTVAFTCLIWPIFWFDGCFDLCLYFLALCNACPYIHRYLCMYVCCWLELVSPFCTICFAKRFLMWPFLYICSLEYDSPLWWLSAFEAVYLQL